MSDDCPCADPPHPRIIDNPPGRESVEYRAGDFVSFRRALLERRAGETALSGWHPEPGQDLGLQLLEWWAYIADIITFYNERAIQETLLRTATLPESARRIVRLLGYRPRPGIGATGVVAALTDALDPFVLPRGFAIEGSAAGQPTQVFELDEDVEVGRVGRPLPASARFPSFQGALATSGSESSSAGAEAPTAERGFTLRRRGGKLRNSVDAKDKQDDDESKTPAGTPGQFFLDGVIASVRAGDTLLIVKKNWAGHLLDPFGYAVATVRAVRPIFDAAEPASTGIEFVAAYNLPAPISQCLVLRSTKQAHLWLYHQRYPGSANLAAIGAGTAVQVLKTIFDPGGLFHGGISTRAPEDPRVLTGLTVMGTPPPHGVAHLEAITRGINAGDLVLFEKRSGGGLGGLFRGLMEGVLSGGALAIARMMLLQLVKVTGYAEDIWYANTPEMDRVGQGPPVGPPSHGLISGGEGAIPIPHSRITFDINPFLDVMSLGELDLDKIVVHHGWEEIGQQVAPASQQKPTGEVEVDTTPDAPPGKLIPALIRDRNGRGGYGWLGQTTRVAGTEGSATSSTTTTTEALVPPLEALLHLLPISRGKSVLSEVLGSGDPTQIGQEFTLKQAPLTYLASTGPRSRDGYESTLRIRVDGVEWNEVASFFGERPDARVFVTREDENQRTHVRFGDGTNGARLPAGTNNVVARYRHGSGAAVPPVGSLTTVPRPHPGLSSIVNPVAVGGGADPQPPQELRRYAPRSVLTFGRAISGDDYETVAAQTPGVSRARAYWGWDPASQRTLVKVFVGDDAPAVAAARKALAAFGDPNRPVRVALAEAVIVDLTLRILVDPAYDADAVRTALARLLLDADQQPFGSGVIRIGEPIYDSQIYEACQRVPGVRAIYGLQFRTYRQPAAAPPSIASAPAAVSETTPTHPNPSHILGKSFILDDLDNPEALALRLGVSLAELSDPVAFSQKDSPLANWRDNFPPPPADPQVETELHFELETGERHVPGEGRFYRLPSERLHVSSEVFSHVI